MVTIHPQPTPQLQEKYHLRKKCERKVTAMEAATAFSRASYTLARYSVDHDCANTILSDRLAGGGILVMNAASLNIVCWMLALATLAFPPGAEPVTFYDCCEECEYDLKYCMLYLMYIDPL